MVLKSNFDFRNLDHRILQTFFINFVNAGSICGCRSTSQTLETLLLSLKYCIARPLIQRRSFESRHDATELHSLSTCNSSTPHPISSSESPIQTQHNSSRTNPQKRQRISRINRRRDNQRFTLSPFNRLLTTQGFLTPTVMESSSSTMFTPSKQLSTILDSCSTDSLPSPMHPNNSSHEESHRIYLLPPRQ